MPYPEVPVEVNYFMFGVLVGMSFTLIFFVILSYVDKKSKNKNINIAKKCDCVGPCNSGTCIGKSSNINV